MSPLLLVPVVSGFGYAVAAIMLKRATEGGSGPWRVTFIANMVMAAGFSLLWLLPSEHPATVANVLHASATGVLFMVGQIFTFLALNRGDVSVATPVLGTKVIFVAFFASALGVAVLTPVVWMAVVITALAAALLGGGSGNTERAAVWRSLIYGFGAAACFGLTDVLQQRWIPAWGFSHYAAMMFLVVAVCSLGLIPMFRAPLRALPADQWRWALAGGAMLTAQACGIVWSILHLGATTSNVLYNSRGMWSVLLVWTVGPWFGNVERSQGRAIMLRRLFGSVLLLTAIALIASQQRP